MVTGFDFGITTDGELVVNKFSHDILKSCNDDLRIQLAFNRLKSVSNNWFIDNIGADLEELVGKPCNKSIINYGKQKIIDSLTFQNLWDKEDIYIKSQIINNTNIVYNIFLKIHQAKVEDTFSIEISVELDLIRGVNVRYGWKPKR